MKTKRMLWLACLAASLTMIRPAHAGEVGLAAGRRGLTLPMPGHQVAFLNKGDHVDVMVSFEAVMKNNRKEQVTATILQNVVVINVQKPAGPNEQGLVELSLNPNETQYAALSYNQGKLFLARRAEGDTAMAQMEMASLRKLFR